jgi:hypothetical protein
LRPFATFAPSRFNLFSSASTLTERRYKPFKIQKPSSSAPRRFKFYSPTSNHAPTRPTAKTRNPDGVNGRRVTSAGRIYLTGGATALLHGWRPMTVDVDLKADPEPAGFFEAFALLKDELAVNIELASPSDFIPELPNWREGSLFIARHGHIDFYHYDPYSQALAKLERGHSRDLTDVEAMLRTAATTP